LKKSKTGRAGKGEGEKRKRREKEKQGGNGRKRQWGGRGGYTCTKVKKGTGQ